MFGASNSVRLFFLQLTTFIVIGLWLTGFDKVHWFTYAVPGFLVFAAATGFCPGLLISKKILNVIGARE